VNLWPTRHAIDVMSRRGITWADVVRTVERPEVTYAGSRYAGDDRIVHQAGDLAVVTTPAGCVVTVLLRTTEQWTDADARQRTA